MSTKLYDGIILNAPQDQFWNVVSQIRENIDNTFNTLNKELTIDYIRQSYIENAVRKHRDSIGTPIKDEKKDSGLFFNALDKWKSEEEGFFKNRLRCKVQIFEPLEDGRILAYVFTNNEEKYYENLLELPFVEEFGYWNNTDKPENLTEEQWNDRYVSWNTVMDRNFFITGSGISVEVAESKNRTFMMPNRDFLKDLNKDIKEEKNSWRKALSIRLVSDAVLNRRIEEDDSRVKDGSMSAVMNIIHSSMDVVSDSDVLPVGEIPEITLDDFMARDTNVITLPEINQRVLDELVEKVLQDIS